MKYWYAITIEKNNRQKTIFSCHLFPFRPFSFFSWSPIMWRLNIHLALFPQSVYLIITPVKFNYINQQLSVSKHKNKNYDFFLCHPLLFPLLFAVWSSIVNFIILFWLGKRETIRRKEAWNITTTTTYFISPNLGNCFRLFRWNTRLAPSSPSPY